MLERVLALLRLHEQDPDYLEVPAGNGASLMDTAFVTEQLGMTIDRYRLVHEIGHGGMGVVCMATQKEPVRRKVALKIIKPGMDTREVVVQCA